MTLGLTLLGILLIVVALIGLWITTKYSKPADLSFLDPDAPKDYEEK